MLKIPLSIQEKLPNQQAGLLTAAFPFPHLQPLKLLSKPANHFYSLFDLYTGALPLTLGHSLMDVFAEMFELSH